MDQLESGSSVQFDQAMASAVVEGAAGRYFAARRQKVAPFVAKHFSLGGTLRLHRHAIGADLLRAPINLLLEVPQFLVQLMGTACVALGARVGEALLRRSLLLETDVAREMVRLIQTELLELPCRQPHGVSSRDALAEEVLADPRINAWVNALILSVSGNSDFRRRLEQLTWVYAGTRSAAAEVATSLLTLGAGALSLKQLTPGAMTLGPSLAAVIAQHSAIASFPLGVGLGALWYSAFPAAASPYLVDGLTGGVLVAIAVVAPFTGLIADPLQRRLGLHERRLHRLIDKLEREFHGGGGSFITRERYVARLLGLLDLLAAAARAGLP